MKREDATIDNVRIHCGQSMRYDAIADGDVFDNQRLTGTYYCERCSTMQPTYETIAPERWRQTLEVLHSTVKGLQSHPHRYTQTVVDRYLYFMETEIDKALHDHKGPSA